MFDEIVITPVLDTAIYAADDVLFDFMDVPLAVRGNGGAMIIHALTVLDLSDQGIAMDLFVASGGLTLGTFNAAPAVTDPNAVTNRMKRLCNVATGDYIDLGGLKQASKTGLFMPVKALGNSKSIFIGGITRGGTPTYAANSLLILLGVEY